MLYKFKKNTYCSTNIW